MITAILDWFMKRKKLRKFFIDYDFEGDTYCIEIISDDWRSAEKKLEAIKRSGRISGELA